ncbi:MAG: hypothetical protein JJE27_01350 [Thermoleophilia bacterium]|nr:hypothetical protein [Thermoleophilia bacterium]
MSISQETADPGRVAVSAFKPNGPVAAVTLAVGVGSAALGILTTLSEASKSISDALNFVDRVGPLSGKTIVAMFIFLGTWAGLHGVLKDRDLPWKPFIQATIAMFIVGVILTFPPFFQLFGSD